MAAHASSKHCATWLELYTQAWIWQHPPRGSFQKVLDVVGDDDAVIKPWLLPIELPGAEAILGAGGRRCSVLWWGLHRRAVFMCETHDGIAHIVAPGFCDEH